MESAETFREVLVHEIRVHYTDTDGESFWLTLDPETIRTFVFTQGGDPDLHLRYDPTRIERKKATELGPDWGVVGVERAPAGNSASGGVSWHRLDCVWISVS